MNNLAVQNNEIKFNQEMVDEVQYFTEAVEMDPAKLPNFCQIGFLYHADIFYEGDGDRFACSKIEDGKPMIIVGKLFMEMVRRDNALDRITTAFIIWHEYGHIVHRHFKRKVTFDRHSSLYQGLIHCDELTADRYAIAELEFSGAAISAVLFAIETALLGDIEMTARRLIHVHDADHRSTDKTVLTDDEKKAIQYVRDVKDGDFGDDLSDLNEKDKLALTKIRKREREKNNKIATRAFKRMGDKRSKDRLREILQSDREKFEMGVEAYDNVEYQLDLDFEMTECNIRDRIVSNKPRAVDSYDGTISSVPGGAFIDQSVL